MNRLHGSLAGACEGESRQCWIHMSIPVPFPPSRHAVYPLVAVERCAFGALFEPVCKLAQATQIRIGPGLSLKWNLDAHLCGSLVPGGQNNSSALTHYQGLVGEKNLEEPLVLRQHGLPEGGLRCICSDKQ